MNDVIATVTANPVMVLTDDKVYSDFYRHMKAECDAFVPDVSTAAGRGKISAQAYKVTRTKTAIDAAGKKLNEDARAKINAVDASRRKIRDELDALADEVRKPLTDWENAEKDRAAKVEAVFAMIDDMIYDPGSSESVRRCAEILDGIVLDPEILRERLDEAIKAKLDARENIARAMIVAEQREADAAELARLRAEREEREIAERIAREQSEAAQCIAETEARTKQEAEDRERRAKEAQDQAIARAVAEEKRRADAIIAAAEAEKQELIRRQELEERQRQSIIAETKRQEEARAADRANRSRVMGEVKRALMTCGADEETAKKIVLAIVAGEVPNVRIVF